MCDLVVIEFASGISAKIVDMDTKELEKVVHDKNTIISMQLRRIHLLEEKFAELHQKYFLLKYKDQEEKSFMFW